MIVCQKAYKATLLPNALDLLLLSSVLCNRHREQHASLSPGLSSPIYSVCSQSFSFDAWVEGLALEGAQHAACPAHNKRFPPRFSTSRIQLKGTLDGRGILDTAICVPFSLPSVLWLPPLHLLLP